LDYKGVSQRAVTAALDSYGEIGLTIRPAGAGQGHGMAGMSVDNLQSSFVLDQMLSSY
jgi:hypothetical protein